MLVPGVAWRGIDQIPYRRNRAVKPPCLLPEPDAQTRTPGNLPHSGHEKLSIVGLRLLETDNTIPLAPLAAPPEQRNTLEALEHIAALLLSAADLETGML